MHQKPVKVQLNQLKRNWGPIYTLKSNLIFITNYLFKILLRYLKFIRYTLIMSVSVVIIPSLATFAIARICGRFGWMDQQELDTQMGQQHYRSWNGYTGEDGYHTDDVDMHVDAIRYIFDPNYFENSEVILFLF